jgi:hypothetical protein
LKSSTKIIALGAACAACCALPVAGPLLAGALAGSALASLGLDTLEWSAGLGAAGLVVFLLPQRRRPGRVSSSASIEDFCGCSGVGNSAQSAQATELAPIACTLTASDFKERVSWIRDLAGESLLRVRREPLALHLTYDVAAADRVREMVRNEEACCAFLRFDLRSAARGIHLTITAPEGARETANELFAYFAPEVAHSTPQSPPTQKEPV